MTVPRPVEAKPVEQLAEVQFTPGMERRIKEILARCPASRAALLPLLQLCQDRYGWIAPGVIEAVARRLGVAPADVEGVVTFSAMFRTEPPARYVLQVCTTLSCHVCGGRELAEHLREKLGIDFGGTTPDGLFQLVDVQCLGACGGAPSIQINDELHENLTPAALDELLDRLRKKG